MKIHNDPVLLAKNVRAFFNKMAAFQRSGRIAPTKEIVTFSGGGGSIMDQKRKKEAKSKITEFKPKLTLGSIADEIKSQREKTSLFMSQETPSKSSSIFSSMEDGSSSQLSQNLFTKRKLSSPSEALSQTTKKRKKIKIVRKDDNLVDQVLSQSDTQNAKAEIINLKQDKRFCFLCYDTLEVLDNPVVSDKKTFMKNYVKMTKILLSRANLDFSEFYSFIQQHLKKESWSKLEPKWEKWLFRLEKVLGESLSKVIVFGLIFLYNKTDTKDFQTEHLSGLNFNDVEKWITNIKSSFDLTKKRLSTIKETMEKVSIDVLSWETKNFLKTFLKFIKTVLFEPFPDR